MLFPGIQNRSYVVPLNSARNRSGGEREILLMTYETATATKFLRFARARIENGFNEALKASSEPFLSSVARAFEDAGMKVDHQKDKARVVVIWPANERNMIAISARTTSAPNTQHEVGQISVDREKGQGGCVSNVSFNPETAEFVADGEKSAVLVVVQFAFEKMLA